MLFSGLTVAAALSSLLIFPQAFLKSMGYGGVAAVLVAMVAALTVLPACCGCWATGSTPAGSRAAARGRSGRPRTAGGRAWRAP